MRFGSLWFGLRLGGGLLSLLLGGTGAWAQVENQTETASQGPVSAQLSWTEPGDGICSGNPRLTIERDGRAILAGPIEPGAEDDWLGLCRVSDLRVLDLDGDRDPEVLVSNYSGGAHCCLTELIYRYDAATQAYQRLEHFWGNGGASLEDLDQDGKAEFVSRDDRFAYAFASYAGSAYPLQIWRYDKGRMRDVTRFYPQRIYGHAYGLWQYQENLKQEFDLPAVGDEEGENGVYLGPIRAALAAYVADKYMLGQQADAWKRLEQLYPWRDRPQFVSSLKDFLRATGYITGNFTQRIQFPEGSTFERVGGRLLPGDRHRYQLRASRGQMLQLKLYQGDIQAQLINPQGKVSATLQPGQRQLRYPLPMDGDYSLLLTAPVESGYSMLVEIP